MAVLERQKGNLK